MQPFQILLVEDDPADANLVFAALRENRLLCNVNHASDGVEALAFLRREGDGNREAPRPDLILLDLNMPRMNGREFLAAVKSDEELTAIPVVVVTTSEAERDVVSSYKLGASGYITKPVNMEQFVNAIRQVNEYWFALIRLPSKG